VDTDKVVEASLRTGPYHVGPGEVLQVTLSSFLGAVTVGQTLGPDQVTPMVCRINDAGKISLPVVGELSVSGLSLSEIEALVIQAYYPAYAKTCPSVFVKLLEARTYRVSISGAVKAPGVYEFRRDRMSLSALLMEAGGIAPEGAVSIRILRSDSADQDPAITLVLPIKGTHASFADVPLQEGDRVLVERLVVPLFTVIGLVNRPGNFEYPPDALYNLIQALGFAGGLDLRLDPRYAVVYRFNPDGSIVHATFQLSNPKEPGALAVGAAVTIKPGDIIAVEHTPRTRTREFLERFVNVNVGAYVPLVR
jgi:polysaccharide export outer membrane protein